MEIEKLFPVAEIPYGNRDEFNEYLIKNYSPEDISHHLTILTGLTKYSTVELENKIKEFGFEIRKKFGVVFYIKSVPDLDELIEAYLVHDENTGLITIYSNYRKTEEIPKIQDFLRFDENSYYLFLKPKLLKEITYKLLNEFDNLEILDFVARRSFDSKLPAVMRPNYKRSVAYWGDDGRFALQEMEHYYGVLPNIVTFLIPDMVKFRVSSEGLFTYYFGNKDGMALFFDIVEETTKEAKKLLEVYNRTSFEIMPINTETKSFEIPVSTPSSISLENQLSYSEVNSFRNIIESAGYTLVSDVAEEGSLFFSADLISDIGNRIRIKATEDEIKVFPDEDRNLHTFMKFYKLILDEVDPNAEIIS